MDDLILRNNQVLKTNDGQFIPVMESFYTIQGEGYHQGKPSFFIRTAGCNVGCSWCDIKESWDASQYDELPVIQIAEEASKFPMKIAVVTGGESFMFNMTPLSKALKARGLQTHVETSGAYEITGDWDWICISPKKFMTPLEENLSLAHELKVIICNKSDLHWAEQYAEKVKKECKLYLQPEWSKREKVMPIVVEYIKNNPKWEVSLQIHKYMNIP